MIKLYRERIEPVEAVAWTGSNEEELMEWMGHDVSFDNSSNDGPELIIHRPWGNGTANYDDYIVKDWVTKGYGVFTPEEFKDIFEEVVVTGYSKELTMDEMHGLTLNPA